MVTPASLIANPKFNDWYPGQQDAVLQIMSWLQGPSRFLCASLPTGSGKSLAAVIISILSGQKATLLTSTKGLQRQYLQDFEHNGMSEIMGQNSYTCRLDESGQTRVDWGPCHAGGYHCEYREKGCSYYDALHHADGSSLTVTNYHYWLAQNHYSEMARPHLLVCDEAHLAFQALQSHLEFSIGWADCQAVDVRFPDDMEWVEWVAWSEAAYPKALKVLEHLTAEAREHQRATKPLLARLRATNDLLRGLTAISGAQGRWIAERHDDSWTFSPLWPYQYADRLFLDVPKVLLMSACMTEKSMDVLGVREDEREWLEAPSAFPPENTPIIHIPTARINYSTPDHELRTWVSRIDQILDRRQDRKGIIFTVSYKRRDFLIANSRHSGIMMTHQSRDTWSRVQQFRRAPAPCVLVSPSITSGWDFPDDDCRFIVIGKIFYPSMISELSKARQLEDKEWSSFVAMDTTQQAAGRGTRSAQDWCEVFITDDNWKWFWPRYRHLSASWFGGRVRGSSDTVPDPIRR